MAASPLFAAGINSSGEAGRSGEDDEEDKEADEEAACPVRRRFAGVSSLRGICLSGFFGGGQQLLDSCNPTTRWGKRRADLKDEHSR